MRSMRKKGGKSSFAALILLICLLSASGADAATPVPDSKTLSPQYLSHVWTTEAGLPQNTVTALVQTRDGYLWVGTFGGLARFDGVTFTVFNTRNTDGLRDNRITVLYEDRDGTLWIGLEHGGLAQYRQGLFTTFAPVDCPRAASPR